MRVLLQRVARASVSINGREIAQIPHGLLILLGVSSQDTEDDARYIVDKTANLRLFADAAGHFNRSALDTSAQLLVVSQFTLYADTRKGRRPDFTAAAPPAHAEALYMRTVEMFRGLGLKTSTGQFREHMLVSLDNDGPVTILLDSADRLRPRRA
ncbi:MAG: D-tyrosyl-tRNA(Tyr) deacylase [SAR202 cluster bacterium]|nr:D-tyrosyl-tRNA(Tyr) deacylase [SAR202 cluster bacterium]